MKSGRGTGAEVSGSRPPRLCHRAPPSHSWRPAPPFLLKGDGAAPPPISLATRAHPYHTSMEAVAAAQGAHAPPRVICPPFPPHSPPRLPHPPSPFSPFSHSRCNGMPGKMSARQAGSRPAQPQWPVCTGHCVDLTSARRATHAGSSSAAEGGGGAREKPHQRFATHCSAARHPAAPLARRLCLRPKPSLPPAQQLVAQAGEAPRSAGKFHCFVGNDSPTSATLEFLCVLGRLICLRVRVPRGVRVRAGVAAVLLSASLCHRWRRWAVGCGQSVAREACRPSPTRSQSQSHTRNP